MNLKQEITHHLTDVIIPFWAALRDDQNGGYAGCVGSDLQADFAAPKGCIHNSRILWFFSSAYTQLGQPALLECARHAYRALDRFKDPQYGGLYWLCAADGTPLDETKHTYNHAFAIYALAAYAKATGDAAAMRQAMEYFKLIESRMMSGGLYADAFDRTFQPLPNDKLSDNPVLMERGMVAQRTMNTMLHVMEAYTLLYTVGKNPQVRQSLLRLLDVIRTQVYDSQKNLLEVFFDGEMHPLIDMQSYGHDIEATWLWDLAANAVLEGNTLQQVQTINTKLAQGVLERALTGQGLLSERVEDFTGSVRVWWVQAETMIGIVNLWQKTGDPNLTAQMEALWEYIQTTFVDQRPGGEWYAEADAQGKPRSLPVADPWKAPYHNGRMCLEIMKRL